ncbi:hypothetical protein SEUCBS140593_003564 [Sporothrix eucalyptigena]|uniref:Rhodopsin domain-containing protein n=1 Tax=Sporothrix eucalyptigena TaxID=1812306 RepID=A0ABP0BG76_9PEZI
MFRLYFRAKSATGLQADDFTITAAMILASTDLFSVFAANGIFVTGASTVSLPRVLARSPLSVVSEVMSAISVPLIKISVTLMLMRLLTSRPWRYFFHAMIAVQVVVAIYVSIMQLTRCIPLSALWGAATGKCWSAAAFRIGLTIASVITIGTDVVLSLAPLAFLLQIRQSRKERTMIGILMGLGLLASGASIAKMAILQTFNSSGADFGQIDGLRIALCANLEEQLGLIAACLPCLKAPFQRFLKRMGVSSPSMQYSSNNTTIRGNTRRSGYQRYAMDDCPHQNTAPSRSNSTRDGQYSFYREPSLKSDQEELVTSLQLQESPGLPVAVLAHKQDVSLGDSDNYTFAVRGT